MSPRRRTGSERPRARPRHSAQVTIDRLTEHLGEFDLDDHDRRVIARTQEALRRVIDKSRAEGWQGNR